MARNAETPFTGGTYFYAFLYVYNLSLGEFDTDNFNPNDQVYLKIMWFINTLITLVVFLNLLIAIMGDTFDRVQETAESNMLKELASIMIENDAIISREKVFKDSKYIIVVSELKADQREISWEGRLKRLRDFMYESVETQSKLLTRLQNNCFNILKDKADRKARDMDSSTSKTIASITNKLDLFEEMVHRYHVKCKYLMNNVIHIDDFSIVIASIYVWINDTSQPTAIIFKILTSYILSNLKSIFTYSLSR